MSCNGCRILRKGCSETCVLRPCLQWIQSPEAQAYATLFLAKFYGRSDLISFVSAVPDHRKSAVFQSLLMEACGRTVNPVNGAVGLLCSGNWHVCQSAVNAVLSGGTLSPMAMNSSGRFTPFNDRSTQNSLAQWKASESGTMFDSCDEIGLALTPRFSKKIPTEKSGGRKRMMESFSSSGEQSSTITSFQKVNGNGNEKKLLKLFV